MREIFVAELAKEVLGPREGIYEMLQNSPLFEYITGILAPSTDKLEREIDNEAEIPVEDIAGHEEETTDVDVYVPPIFSPVLDPKKIPATMGLSFILQSAGTPEIDICLTWARYFRMKNGNVACWVRKPRKAVHSINIGSDRIYWIDKDGMLTTSASSGAEISLHVIVQCTSDRYFVTLYLVNRVRVGPNENVNAEHHIFQPQIRVLCAEGTRIVPDMIETSSEREDGEVDEKERLQFLYRNRHVLAKGHMCSAIWKEIDPEIPPTQTAHLDFPDSIQNVPFKWQDGELLQPSDRNRFSRADVRTEFIPVYSIPSPDLHWRDEYGTQPELRCEKLAEIWNPQEMRSSLWPIVDAYSRWIKDLHGEIVPLSQQNARYGIIAREFIQRCTRVLDRMKAGIDLLCTNNEARLAFCFTNKAMDQQRRWKERKGLTWYPFQLAFILMFIESMTCSDSPNRNVCDLLWVPTGAGKTEAYMAVMTFTLAYRRLQALRQTGIDRTGAGVSSITRYTLRLLTIQQFRRILALVTACEYLRVYNLSDKNRIGWRPNQCPLQNNFIWGSTPFSVGLWVGGNVTPNRLKDSWGGNRQLYGAITILKGKNQRSGQGEPAQILNCPACDTILAIPEMGIKSGTYSFYFVLKIQNGQAIYRLIQLLLGRIFQNARITNATVTAHRSPLYCTLKLDVETQSKMKADDVDNFWNDVKAFLNSNKCPVELVPARASRMGYFIRNFINEKGMLDEYDFEIICPNPDCDLHQHWCAGGPMGWSHGARLNPYEAPQEVNGVHIPDGNKLWHIQEPFRENSPHISDRIPIPAMTVDDQIYNRLPSIVVATVDKFARMPFEPRVASLFGNVTYHHLIYGYYRPYQHQSQSTGDGHPVPAGRRRARFFTSVAPLRPPDLILQDELHLIEGPLGSLTGVYESAIDYLCQKTERHRPKYIASTATVRRAEEQVQAVFLRELQIFPPYGLSADDRFFIKESEVHPYFDGQPGRLYMGILAPGKGPLTPVVRIWSRLLQTAFSQRNHRVMDDYWTLTGYFNAVRELAGVRALYRQDIPQRIREISLGNSRPIPDELGLELSSRTSSTDLPSILNLLNSPYPDAPDVLLTTSMFGTGVDILRIGLMVVHGQPKTTSAYIQSTGRVGRRRGALVVTFFRATRPRDLSHYEYFCGYHRQLHRFVEPITVYPFAPGVLERVTGPVGVAILRNMKGTTVAWDQDGSATKMATQRTQAQEVRDLPVILESRAQNQPALRRPTQGSVFGCMNRKLDAWQSFARNLPNLKYVEYAITTQPVCPVVLGDAQHKHARLGVVYENAPQSLRDIEEMTGFET